MSANHILHQRILYNFYGTVYSHRWSRTKYPIASSSRPFISMKSWEWFLYTLFVIAISIWILHRLRTLFNYSVNLCHHFFVFLIIGHDILTAWHTQQTLGPIIIYIRDMDFLVQWKDVVVYSLFVVQHTVQYKAQGSPIHIMSNKTTIFNIGQTFSKAPNLMTFANYCIECIINTPLRDLTYPVWR